MTTKNLPISPNEDDMANNWGTEFVVLPYQERKSDRLLCYGSKAELEGLVRNLIPNYRLNSLLSSGSAANDKAVLFATGLNQTLCLFAAGCYVSGSGLSQQWSTSDYSSDKKLGLVMSPEKCDVKALSNIVPFPYHVPHSELRDDNLKCMEEKCLESLSVKLLIASLQGVPFKALLFEYISSGTGGTLTTRFLLRLAAVLKRFNVVIIADEIMTGCRVGPSLTMTTGFPKEFQERVAFITLGKSFGCGMLIDKVSNTFTIMKERGTSTEIKHESVYPYLRMIQEGISAGYITSKRSKVLDCLDVSKNLNHHWGEGLMIFTSRARHKVLRTLKCRCLPRLEISPQTKITTKGTLCKWTRITVNEHLKDACDLWLAHNESVYDKQLVSPYTVALARHILSMGSLATTIEFAEYKRSVILSDPDSTFVSLHRANKRKRHGSLQSGRCKKQRDNLLWESLSTAALVSQGFLTARINRRDNTTTYEVNYSAKEE